MKNKKSFIINVVKIVVVLAIFIFLILPSINPLLKGDTKDKVANEIKKCFGIFKDGENSAVFSVEKIIAAVAVALFVWLVTKVVCLIVEKTSAGRKRSKTVAGMVTSILKALGTVLAFIWVLSVMGVNLAAIFASLGVVSLILGFGVQSLIEDCVTGIFIIISGEYNIGDIIVLEDFRGTVERISMRTTTIRDDGGNLKIINNSDIRNIQNRSNNQSLASCEIGISYSANLLEVEEIINAALPEIYERNKDVFENVPRYSGVQSLGASAVILRILVNVSEKNIFPATRRLNREMKLLFDEHGIEIPFNQLVVRTEK